MTPPEIKGLFSEPGKENQRKEIIALISEAEPGTASTNYHLVLHKIMDPGSPDFNPLQKQFLTRYSRNAARALGRAFIDRNVSPAGTYHLHDFTATLGLSGSADKGGGIYAGAASSPAIINNTVDANRAVS